MKLFIFKILKYSGILIFLFVVKFLIFRFIYINTIKPISTKETVIIGDSHMERGWRPDKNETVLAKSAETLFFSLNRLALVKDLKDKTVVIGVSNLLLNDQERIIESENIQPLLKRWFLILNLSDNLTLVRNNFKGWLKSFFAVGVDFIDNPNISQCGYAPIKETGFKPASNRLIIIDSQNIKRNISIQRLFKFIKEHTNSKIILVRMPLYLDRSPIINELEFMEFVKILKSLSKNVEFIDYSKEFEHNKKYFYDWDHLNYVGADSFYFYRRKLLNKVGNL